MSNGDPDFRMSLYITTHYNSKTKTISDKQDSRGCKSLF